MTAGVKLMEQLDAATEGSRALDATIFRELGEPLPEQFANLKLELTWRPDGSAWMPVGEMQVRYEPPAYTTSLDAIAGIIERRFPGQLPAFLALAAHRSQSARELALGLCVTLVTAISGADHAD